MCPPWPEESRQVVMTLTPRCRSVQQGSKGVAVRGQGVTLGVVRVVLCEKQVGKGQGVGDIICEETKISRKPSEKVGVVSK